MKTRDLYFAIGIIAVIAILYFLSATGKKPPAIPPDTAHVAAVTVDDCKGCHAEGKASPLKKEHPPKDQCFECHKMKKEGHGVMR
jgi:hypothetical protein